MNIRRQIVIAAAIAVGVTVLFFFFLLKPKLSDISKARDDVQTARSEEQTLRVELQHLQDVRKNAPQTTAQLASLSQSLPSNADLPGFIQQVQDAATRSGIDLQTIAPSPPADVSGATGVQAITVGLTAQGGFFRVEDFLARLENLSRAVEVRALSLAPVATPISSELILNTTFTLNMFIVQPNATALGAVRVPSASASPSPSASATGSP